MWDCYTISDGVEVFIWTKIGSFNCRDGFEFLFLYKNIIKMLLQCTRGQTFSHLRSGKVPCFP